MDEAGGIPERQDAQLCAVAAATVALRAAVDALQAAELAGLSEAGLVAALDAVERQTRRLPTVRDALVAQVQRRDVASSHGARSASAWLQARFLIGRGEARMWLRGAERLTARVSMTGEPLEPLLPDLAEARAAGDLSTEQVKIIDDLDGELPAGLPVEARREVEQAMVAYARQVGPTRLLRAGQRLLDVVDPDGAEPQHEEARRRRGLTIGPLRHGLARVSGHVDAWTREALLAILTSFPDSDLSPPHPRTDPADPYTATPNARGDCHVEHPAAAPTANSASHDGNPAEGQPTRGSHGDGDDDSACDVRGGGCSDEPPTSTGTSTADREYGSGCCACDGDADREAAVDGSDYADSGCVSGGGYADGDCVSGGGYTDGDCGCEVPSSADGTSCGESAPAWMDSRPAGGPPCSPPDSGATVPAHYAQRLVGRGSTAPHGPSAYVEQARAGGDPATETPPSLPQEPPPGDYSGDPRPHVPLDPDRRTQPQRLHDALSHVLGRIISSGRLPRRGGTPTTVLLTIPLSTLEARTGYASTAHGGDISTREVIRRAADTSFIPIVIDQVGNPLYLGRSRRLASPQQRHALHIRDGGCVIPGCLTPSPDCDAHHLLDWADGGRTDITNLALLCPYHHHRIHGWTLELKEGRIWCTPPAGMSRDPGPQLNNYFRSAPPDPLFD